MTPAALLELADRVERLVGRDREVDAEIAAALRLFPPNVGYVWQGEMKPNSPEIGAVECCTRSGTGGPWYRSKAYTASLDAAMTLVTTSGKVHCIGESEYVSYLSKPWMAMVIKRGEALSSGHTCYAATPALALTAAALRARAQETNS